jgi:hypothetical protein
MVFFFFRYLTLWPSRIRFLLFSKMDWLSRGHYQVTHSDIWYVESWKQFYWEVQPNFAPIDLIKDLNCWTDCKMTTPIIIHPDSKLWSDETLWRSWTHLDVPFRFGMRKRKFGRTNFEFQNRIKVLAQEFQLVEWTRLWYLFHYKFIVIH